MTAPNPPGPAPERSVGDSAEERSLDLVQRLIISALVIVVLGGPTVAVAAYSAVSFATRPGDALGLWIMGAILGLATAIAVCVIHRRAPYSPGALVGLLPAAIAAWFIWA